LLEHVAGVAGYVLSVGMSLAGGARYGRREEGGGRVDGVRGCQRNCSDAHSGGRRSELGGRAEAAGGARRSYLDQVGWNG
jgi:hypothetical protein